MWSDDLNEPAEGGRANDTFLHMVDAWVESKMGSWTDAKINAAMRKLEVFTEAMGDRFADAADLERAHRSWALQVGPRKAAGCVVVTEVLAFWKAVEKLDAEAPKRS